MKTKSRNLYAIAAIISVVLCGVQNVDAANLSSYTTLQSALAANADSLNIGINENSTVTAPVFRASVAALTAVYSSLEDAVSATELDRSYTLVSAESTTGLGVLGGDGATLTIYGNGHSISSTGAGITVENGQTLNSHKVIGWSSSGLSSALIENNGTTALKNSIYENNSNVVINNSGKFSTIGTDFRNNSGTTAVNNASTGEVRLSGGTFEGNNRAITNANKLTLTNVTVKAGSGAAKNDINTTDELILTGTNNLNSDISGSGSITNQGTANLTGDNSQYIGTYTQSSTSAVTNVNDGKFFGGQSTITGGTLNWLTSNDIENTANLTLSGNSKLNVGDDAHNTTLSINTGSSIADTATVAVSTGSTLNVSGGNVILNSDDTDINGTVHLTDGSLLLNNFTTSGTINAEQGNLTVGSVGTTKLIGQTTIRGDVTTNISGRLEVNNAASDITLNLGDALAGTLNLKSGNLTLENFTTGGSIIAETGNFIVNGNTTLNGVTTINGAVNTTVNGTLAINNSNANTNVVFNSGDSIEGGKVDLQAGKLTLDGNFKTTTGEISATGGSVVVNTNIDLKGKTTIDADAAVQINGNLNVENSASNIVLNNNDTIASAGKLSLNAGTLALNGFTTSGEIAAANGNVSVAGTTNLNGKTTIADTVAATINGTMNINNADSSVTLNNNDEITGTVNLKSGNLTLDGLTTSGTINADGGNVTVNNNTVLNGVTTIANAANVAINGTLNVNNSASQIALNSTSDTIDKTNGKFSLQAGQLTLTDFTTEGEIAASGGKVIINGTNDLKGKTTIDRLADLDVKGTLGINNADSNVIIDSTDKLTGLVKLSDGNVTVDSITTPGGIYADGGVLTVNGNTSTTGYTELREAVKLVVNSGSEFKLNNGNVNTNIVLDSDDEINGTVNMEMGKLTLETLETEGTILASGGQFIVNGNNTLNGVTSIAGAVTTTVNGTLGINNSDTNTNIVLDSNDSIEGGKVDLQNGKLTLNGFTTTNGEIAASGGNVVVNGTNNLSGKTTIEKNVIANINGSLNIDNADSNVVLSGNDTIANSGKVSLVAGTLNLDGLTTGGEISANSGNVTIDGVTNLNGKTTIGDGATTQVNGTLNINNTNSNVTLNTGDTITGTVGLKSGNLNVTGLTTAGIIDADGGNLTFSGTNNLTGTVTVADAVNTIINDTLTVNNANSNIVLNSTDALNGAVNLADGTLNLKGLTTNGTIDVDGGKFIVDGRTTLKGETTIDAAVETVINNGAVLALNNANSTVTLNRVDETNKDTWNGTVELTNGTLNTEGLTANGAIQAIGGNINIKSGDLKIEGTSYIGNASNQGADVNISNGGSLIFNKDSIIVRTITGTGNITVNGSKLTFNSGSSVDNTLGFTSTNNSTAVINANNASVNDILHIINNGTNTGLTIDVKNNNISENLTIDGTNISQLKLAGGTYSGNLVNNGTVSNTGVLNLSGQMSGSGIFNNSANTNVTADQSGFKGTYNQSTGNLVVDANGKIFGGDKNINGGTVSVTSNSAIDYGKVHLGSGTKLTHNSQEGVDNTIDKSTVDFKGSNATAEFVSGNYHLAEKVGNNKSNNVVFKNSNVTLGSTDYKDGAKYQLVGSDLNLVETIDEGVQTNHYQFDNLTANNSTLSFNVKIVDGGTPGSKVLETDRITITNNSGTQFKFGNIYITGEENGYPEKYNTVNNVLTNATFVGQPDVDNITFATGATTSWEYDVKSANSGHSISMEITNYTDENTLYKMNDTEGVRFFQFSDDGTDKLDVYHIGQSLGETKGPRPGQTDPAIFNVTGHNRDKNIISGLIESTGAKGSLFDIHEGTNIELNIKNLTIQDADKSGDGSVVYNNSTKGNVTLSNVGIKNNGGTSAIYNAGTLSVDKSIFEGNTGIAINNTGTSTITGTEFKNNTGSTTVQNAGEMTISNSKFSGNTSAISNTNKLTLNNVTVDAGSGSAKNDINTTGELTLTGTNNLNSDISGSGSIENKGTVNLTADNSQYTGVYTQAQGTTNVNNGKFFGGESTITGGTLNWLTSNDIEDTAKLVVSGNGTRVNVGNTANNTTLTIKNGSSIANEAVIAIAKDSTLGVDANGTVNINGNDVWSGKVEVTDGILNISGRDGNGQFVANGGEVNLNSGNLYIAEGSKIIGDGSNPAVTIADKTNLNITGGDVTLNSNDTWTGAVNVGSGNLVIDNVTSNGVITAKGNDSTVTLKTGGNLNIGKGSAITEAVTVALEDNTVTTISDKGGLALNTGDSWLGDIIVNKDGLLTVNNIDSNGKLTANSGTVNVKSGSLEIAADSSIKNDANVIIANNSTLKVTGGDVELNGDDWKGTVEVTSGQLDLSGYNNTNKKNGKFIAKEGGTVNINQGTLTVAKGSEIAGVSDDVATSSSVKIKDGTELLIAGGKVTLDANDLWDGLVTMTSGTLNIEARDSNKGVLHADAGNLNFSTGTLTIENGSYIDLDVKVALPENSVIDIKKGGTVAINDNDIWDGEITLNGGVLNYGTTHSGTLTANTGDMNLLSGSVLNIQIPSQVADEVNVDIQKNALVNIRNGAEFNLDSKDKWSGMINNGGGTLTTSQLTNSTGSGGGLQQTAGTSIFKDNSHISITDANSYIRGGDVQILDNSSLYFGAGTAELNVDNLTMDGSSLLNVMNGKLNTSNITNMTVNGKNDVSINITPRDWTHDKFVVDTLKSDSKGTVNISDFDFLGYAPIDRHIKMQIFDVKSIQNVKFDTTDKEIFTPIGWYDLKSVGGGYFTSNMVRYNPQVFRGQVATQAMYNNQLAIDDMLLNHVSLQSERLLAQGHNANKYAINASQFAPYQYKKEDGGLWFKSYVNFETLSLTRGLHVNNNAYGSIVGADFPVVNMKNGWKFMPTAFIAYNGSHQTFSKVGMYQNGGQGGFMGTFMKDDFIGSVLAYGGGYSNEMSVAGFNDYSDNWFAGTAAKLAYNLHATEHFTVQPTAFVSYNIFGKQNWNTDFGTMSMNSGLLNGVNVAPGVNLIYARETWNMYATIQYMININDQVGGRAGNVNLASIDMKHGYIQYGVGVTKTWKDRLSSYFQILLRNGGRTGVGFQLGLQYLFGMKNPVHVKNNTKTKVVKNKNDIEVSQTKNVSQKKKVVKSLSMK